MNTDIRYKNILVTGGAGFIGSNLCRKLINDGVSIWCLDNLITGKIENVKDYKLLGVDELGDSSIVYAVDITCKAMTNYAIKREVLKMIKKKFDREGINIPYTTVDVNIRK